MKFYNQQHQYYCGIDLHARKMYVCILDQKGKTMVHENIKTDPEALLQIIRPYLEDKLATLEGRHVIIYPLAFTVDNSETECELAIEYAEKAQQLGLASYTVTKAPNDHPLFVATLISLLNRCQSFKSVI